MKRWYPLPRLWRGGALAALATATSLAGCRDATEITLHVHTDMPCSADDAWHGVAVYVGKPGQELETAAPTLVTRTCDQNGNVGSLVVVPSSSKSAAVGLRVVAGIDAKPEVCQDNGYVGCIVARRALRFTPHDGLDVDVELTADCVSKPCDPTHSCLNGSCVVSDVAQATGPTAALLPVRCGDDGVRCATSGDICCLSVDVERKKTTGDCRQPDTCPAGSIRLFCDDDDDCPDDDATGRRGICWLSYVQLRDAPYAPDSISMSSCRLDTQTSVGNQWGLALCENADSCLDGDYTCRGTEDANFPINRLPGYHWCSVSNLPP